MILRCTHRAYWLTGAGAAASDASRPATSPVRVSSARVAARFSKTAADYFRKPCLSKGHRLPWAKPCWFWLLEPVWGGPELFRETHPGAADEVGAFPSPRPTTKSPPLVENVVRNWFPPDFRRWRADYGARTS